jgi:hypothetical protein
LWKRSAQCDDKDRPNDRSYHPVGCFAERCPEAWLADYGG